MMMILMMADLKLFMIVNTTTIAIIIMIIVIRNFGQWRQPIVLTISLGVMDGGSNLWFCVGFWPKHCTHTNPYNWYEVVPKK